MIVSVRDKLCSPFPTERRKPSIYCPSGKLALLVARPTKQNDNPFNIPRLLLKYHNRLIVFYASQFQFTLHKNMYRALYNALEVVVNPFRKKGTNK